MPSPVHPSVALCNCIKTVQARSRNLHLSFVKDSSLGIRKAFLKIRTESSQRRELNKGERVEKFAIFNIGVKSPFLKNGVR